MLAKHESPCLTSSGIECLYTQSRHLSLPAPAPCSCSHSWLGSPARGSFRSLSDLPEPKAQIFPEEPGGEAAALGRRLSATANVGWRAPRRALSKSVGLLREGGAVKRGTRAQPEQPVSLCDILELQ